MKVYPPRDIRPFVMYCVNGKPRSSLLIESTDSMIYIYDEDFSPLYDKCGARSGSPQLQCFLFNIQCILKHDFFPRALFCRLAFILKHVLVPTAVSTTRRARSPCDVEGSLDKPVNLDNQHISQPH